MCLTHQVSRVLLVVGCQMGQTVQVVVGCRARLQILQHRSPARP